MKTNPIGRVHLSAAAILSIALNPLPAPGQNAAPNTLAEESPVVLEEFEVMGMRAGLENAIEIKQNADVVVDVISSVDIGKFPDQNIAESLQRVVGVQIERSRGEGTRASVRGLDPKFNSVQFNGRTLTSASGGGRAFNFLLLQPEFLRSLEVYKTASADLEEGALAGTINATTFRPLDIKDRRIVVNAEMGYDQNSTEWDPRVSAVYSNSFNDGKLGILVGAGYSRRQQETHSFTGFGFENGSEAGRGYPGLGGGGQPLDYNVDGDYDDTVRFDHAIYFQAQPVDRKRTNGILTLQFKPSDSIELYVDGLYAKFDEEYVSNDNALRFTNVLDTTPLRTSDQLGTTIPSDAVRGSVIEQIGGENYAVQLDVDGVDFRNNSRRIIADESTSSFAGGFKWDGGGALKLDGEIARSFSKRLTSSLGLEVIGRANAAYDLRDDPGGVPVITYMRGFDPLDPSGFRATSFNGALNQRNSEASTDVRLDADLEVEWGAFKSIEFGAKFSNREHYQGNRFLNVNGTTMAALAGQTVDATNPEGPSFSAAPFMGVIKPSSQFLSAVSGGENAAQEWLSYRPDLLYALVSEEEIIASTPVTVNQPSVSQVTEDVLAGYVKGNFSGKMGDVPFSGNIGVRVARTSQQSDGFAPDFSQIVFSQAGASTIIPSSTYTVVNRTYTDFLPSANVRFKLSDRLDLRVAASRVMSRPDLGLLSTGTTISANTGVINSNNPELDPYRADTLDVSFEYYGGKGTLLSVTPFLKKIDSFIETITTPEPRSVTIDTGGTTVVDFIRRAPGNGNGTNLKGVELGFQQPFGRGFGILANYTYVKADDVQPAATGALPILLTGISKNSYNLIAYYENRTFGARLAYNYRDEFITSERSFFGDGEKAGSYNQLDATANVRLNDRFTVTLSVLNLTDEIQTRHTIATGFTRLLEDNGRRFIASLRATF